MNFIWLKSSQKSAMENLFPTRWFGAVIFLGYMRWSFCEGREGLGLVQTV